jgi:hypothetical protein
MEPGAQGVAHPEAAGLPDQDEEGGLEGVVRVVRVVEHAPADAEDHRPVPLDQGREGQLRGLAAAGREPLQELAVSQLPGRPDVVERADLPEDGPVFPDRHGWGSPPARPLPMIRVM